MHQLMAKTLDTIVVKIKSIQANARAAGFEGRPRWPMIVLAIPKGMDRSRDGGWQACGGHVSRAPGAIERSTHQSRRT